MLYFPFSPGRLSGHVDIAGLAGLAGLTGLASFENLVHTLGALVEHSTAEILLQIF
jgi:hypothetical protein